MPDYSRYEFIKVEKAERVATEAKFPIAFGVITCNTIEQAVERSSPGSGNKGWEAALAAIEMANLWRALRSEET